MVDGTKRSLEAGTNDKRLRSVYREKERRLALELRAQRFGFAVFEGGNLLDWGGRDFGTGLTGALVAVRKVRTLLVRYTPSVVISRRTRRLSSQSPSAASVVLQKITTELTRRSVRFEILSREKIHQFFAQYGCNNKHDIAAMLTLEFPVLRSILPRRRRPWNPEAYAIAIFDAVATNVVQNNSALAGKKS